MRPDLGSARRALAIFLLALAFGTAVEAATVAYAVTTGLGSAQNPLDKPNQRKFVRDAG
jgi:hypothetical protein